MNFAPKSEAIMRPYEAIDRPGVSFHASETSGVQVGYPDPPGKLLKPNSPPRSFKHANGAAWQGQDGATKNERR